MPTIRAHQEARLADAEASYQQILNEQANHAGALHLLGVVRHQRGDHDSAIELIGRALAIEAGKAVCRIQKKRRPVTSRVP